MADPQLTVSGPFRDDGAATGDPLNLYLTDQASDTSETDTNPSDIPTQDDSETILASLSGRRELRYTGETSGIRLMQAGFGSNPVDAVVNYLFHLESLVLAEQGVGYEIVDGVRNKTYQPGSETPGVLFNLASWEYEAGEGHRVEWTIEATITEGMQDTTNRANYISDQQDRRENIDTDRVVTEESVEVVLGEVTSRMYEREIDLAVMDMVHQFDVPNFGIVESGVQGEVNLEGRISDRDVDDLGETALLLNEDLHGVQSEFYDALTGRRFRGAVEETDTSFEAGSPNILEYRLDLVIGEEIFD